MSDHPAQVSITLDGRPHTVPRGRSLAAALIATDHPVTRHDRAGRPRAPYCGMGVCFDCAVTVDDTPLVRACQEPVRAGMRVDTGGGVGTGGRGEIRDGVDTEGRGEVGGSEVGVRGETGSEDV
ncbi:(2Fe-2S)-binding protein [Embleya sp. NPDC005575]|uniref:(2Fe-2S)-binding protein n=1 Tax=Embleya sp. NPDC005575 TaxID=3156892 RepID=UPI0033B478DD